MNGRILVMDDDESICRIFVLMLNRLGYEAETAASGEEAIQRYRQAREAGKPFQAVILDLTIREGMGGEATLQALRAVDPDVRAVCSSGQSREGAMEACLQQGFKAVLPKPFRYQEVADCMKALLGSGTGA